MAIYYVDPVSGTDDVAHGLTPGADAWASTQFAVSSATAGNEVRLCNTGIETVSASITQNVNSGTTESDRILFKSYNSTGTTPEDGYTLQAGSAISSILEVTDAAYIKWEGVIFDGNSGNATVAVQNLHTANIVSNVYERCRFTDAASEGFDGNHLGGAAGLVFIECEFDNNVDEGYNGRNLNDGSGHFISCRIHNNGGNGIYLSDSGLSIMNCQIYSNGGRGIYLDATYASILKIIGNTFYGNTSSAIEWDANSPAGHIIYNNTFVSNSYGIYWVNIKNTFITDYNHYHNNTNEWYLSGDTASDETNKQTGDPLFTDPANGDFTPLAGSPLINNGIDGSTIGAVNATSAGTTIEIF